MNTIKCTGLKIAQYDFINRSSMSVKTSKAIISLSDYGQVIICSDKLNDLSLLEEFKCVIKINDKNKFELVELVK